MINKLASVVLITAPVTGFCGALTSLFFKRSTKMKSLTSRQSATTGLIALGSILASFLIASVFAESASTQALTNANSDLLPRVLTVSNGKIAFGGEQTVSREVFVMNPDGSNETAITSLGGRDPAYSPDGTKIAFSSFRDFLPNNWSKLYVMNADGSNPVKLTNDANDEQTPSWSPDGTKIVFTRRDGTTGGNGEIYVIDANGSNLIRLTNDAADDDFASYSPDGTKIVFHSLRTGNYHVFIMNADGSSQTIRLPLPTMRFWNLVPPGHQMVPSLHSLASQLTQTAGLAPSSPWMRTEVIEYN